MTEHEAWAVALEQARENGEQLAEIRTGLAVLAEGLSRTEAKVDFTNGKVADLVAWRIGHDAVEAEREREAAATAHAVELAADQAEAAEAARDRERTRRDTKRNVYLAGLLGLGVAVVAAVLAAALAAAHLFT